MSAVTIALLGLAASLAVGLAVLHWSLGAKRLRLQQKPADLGMPAETLTIPVDRRHRLFAWWIAAPTPSDATVVVLHGWGSSAAQLLPLALPFHRAGFNVLLFDARNHGRSDRHGIASLPAFADDLATVREWLRHDRPAAVRKEFLVGHSVGAGAVLFEACRHPGAAAVISLAAFADPASLMTRMLRRHHLPRWGIALVLRYIQWVIGHRFAEIAPVHTIRRLDCPALVVHGTADTTVPLDDAKRLCDACPPKRCRCLFVSGADHESIEPIEQHGAALVSFLRDAAGKAG